MAVDNVASCFRVCATAMDGVVEAYESVLENWWCLGVQFHPESRTSSALDMQVFEVFLEGVKEQAAPAILSFEQRRAA
jgi:putative glutamine amidotransferase